MRVRVEAPSSPFPDDKLQAGAARLREAGFEVDTSHAGPRGGHAFLNGGDDERRRSLEESLRADTDIVWLARGGYGLTRILDALVLPPAGVRMPLVVGFSDATALLLHLAAHGRPGHVHGPLLTTVAREEPHSFAQLRDVLYGRPTRITPLRSHAGDFDVEGPVFAANLCVLGHLVQTRSMPSLEGAILVLEEIGERPYRLDRMLTHLIAAGVLRGVRAVVVGQLLQCDEPPGGGTRDAAPAPLEVFLERLSGRVPVVSGAPVGHGTPNFSIPVGARGRLSARGDNVALELGPRAIA